MVARLPKVARTPGVVPEQSRRHRARVKPESETEGEGEGEGDLEEQQPPEPTPGGPLRLAFIGKPNVGKSSLVNCLLGEERVLVHDAPGTTRDPIDTPFSFGGREYVLVDTAGMRRRRTIDTLTEHVAAKMARDQLARCDVAALVIDAREGATAEDARLASLIEDAGPLRAGGAQQEGPRRPRGHRRQGGVDARGAGVPALRPVLLTSAVTRAGVTTILPEATRALRRRPRAASPPAELNKLLEQIIAHKPPPAGRGGRHVRLYFATQACVRPPTFFLSTNHPAEVAYPYRRFLINRFREAYGFEGTPLRLALRAHKQKLQQPPPSARKND